MADPGQEMAAAGGAGSSAAAATDDAASASRCRRVATAAAAAGDTLAGGGGGGCAGGGTTTADRMAATADARGGGTWKPGRPRWGGEEEVTARGWSSRSAITGAAMEAGETEVGRVGIEGTGRPRRQQTNSRGREWRTGFQVLVSRVWPAARSGVVKFTIRPSQGVWRCRPAIYDGRPVAGLPSSESGPATECGGAGLL